MTKVIVVKRKKLMVIATIVIIAAIIIFILARKNTSDSKAVSGNIESKTDSFTETDNVPAQYIAGIYTAPLTLGEYKSTLTVLVDEDRIKAVTLTGTESAVSTMYPLISDEIKKIDSYLKAGSSVSELMSNEENSRSSLYLLESISALLEKAEKDKIYTNTEKSPS